MDPWRDKPLEKRPKNERKFSLKDPVDRRIFLLIGSFALVLLIIIIVLLCVFFIR